MSTRESCYNALGGRVLMRYLRVAAITILCLFASIRVSVQGFPSEPDMTIDASTRDAVIDGVLKELTDYYVFPDTAARMTQSIWQRRQRREYDAITSGRTLAEVLTAHLRERSGDRHLAVRYSATVLPQFPFPSPPPPPEALEDARRQHYGFAKVDRLAGNIGYLDLRAFAPARLMGDTAAAAMTSLADSAAVILDLRQNGGGGPDGVALIASYLFDHPVRLDDIYDRPSNETRQYWTLESVPGKRLTRKDVYVLTSGRTFSAAEDFTYALKNLKRVTVVGEVTGGGAHLARPRRVNDHFVVIVPVGRPISPVTHTDWEGTGVQPDIKVSAAQALDTAHLKALEKIAPAASGPMKTEVFVEIERLRRELKINTPR